ncbi:hypothetical protein E0H73_28740 [Kribbella pittospori]|uniref:Uncharacterized protein n=1 Tax=Kribbella pittospori TaxID=722689 RepID=A0A4V2MA99_9ACTN|nr:hypothetical protein [Kribbella pittospori]TCC58302.1 hypothetical protein E0H73_28740 [Kribbella pittospori]
MQTIKIRDLRGSRLEQHARQGELVGLTRDRALIAVVIPAGQAWVEHLVDRNWSHVTRQIAEGEADVADSGKLATLDEVLAEADIAVSSGPAGAARRAVRGPGDPSGDEYVSVVPDRPGNDELAEELGRPTAAMLRRLGAQFGAASADGNQITRSSTIRVRDLSARRIDEAGASGELLVLTNDGLQVGIVVPVSQRFVEFLVTQNLSRIMYDAQRAELQSLNREQLETLDEDRSTEQSPTRR